MSRIIIIYVSKYFYYITFIIYINTIIKYLKTIHLNLVSIFISYQKNHELNNYLKISIYCLCIKKIHRIMVNSYTKQFFFNTYTIAFITTCKHYSIINFNEGKIPIILY